jgi:hypothetical protein
MFYVLAVLAGAIAGYAFRGYISKEKNAVGNDIKAKL